MKRFRVMLKLPVILEFEDDRATEKTAAFVGPRVANLYRDWWAKKIEGRVGVESEDEAIEVLSVTKLPDRR